MEIRPILSALMHHKTGTFLVALQIAVSLAIIVNAMFIIHARIEKVERPTGIDNHNLIAVSLRGVNEDYDAQANIQRDLDMLRQMPNVVDATIVNQILLSGSGSSTGFRTVPDENKTPIVAALWEVDEQGIKTLGAHLARGRNFYPEEIQLTIPGKTEPQAPAVLIVTQAMADELFPHEDALGKTIYWGSKQPSKIIGIIDHMQGSWPNWSGFERNILQPRVNASRSVKYMVRTQPGERDKMMPLIEKKLAKLNSQRVIRYVRSEDDIIKRSYEVDVTMVRILGVVIVLLISLVALVIVGLASYFVSQRTRQIGTRRALGATRADILRYFMVENWLITTFGAIVGSVLTVALSYLLETSFDLPRLDWRYLAVSVVVLWLVSLFAAYWPARKASGISPAIATRTV